MEYGIALGSNIGDRLDSLRRAVALLEPHRQPGIQLLKAPVYETTPVDCNPGSGAFLNTVIIAHFSPTPRDLLDVTQKIEQTLGREEKRQRNAPRVVDLDLLYADAKEIATDVLTLPHPRLSRRRFVLEPLARVRPDLILPGQGATIRELLDTLHSDEPPLTLHVEEW